MKCLLRDDEWFFIHLDPLDGGVGAEVDIHQGVFERYRRALDEFAEVQSILAALFPEFARTGVVDPPATLTTPPKEPT